MKIFAISDFHLSFSSSKPMDIFGDVWEDYWEKILQDADKKVSDDDLILIAGDISWAMSLSDAEIDLKHLSLLKGKKIIIRGNHDYWWSSYSKVKTILPQNVFAIQNNAIKFNNIVICGSRGWGTPENEELKAQDKKIYDRELIRMRISLEDAQKKCLRDEDKIIALIHYPPFNSHYEDSEFTRLFEEFGVNKVIYGHIHGKKSQVNKKVTKANIEYYLTSCDILNNQLLEIIL